MKFITYEAHKKIWIALPFVCLIILISIFISTDICLNINDCEEMPILFAAPWQIAKLSITVFVIVYLLSSIVFYKIYQNKQKEGEDEFDRLFPEKKSPWKKRIIIVLAVLLFAFFGVNSYFSLPPKEERNILGYPERYSRGASRGNFGSLFSGDERYFFEHRGDLYYHQPASISISGHGSRAFDFKIENGDPDTFQFIDSNFAKDKNQVYYWGSIVEKADPNTFQTLDWPKAKDKNYYFRQNKITGPVDENADTKKEVETRSTEEKHPITSFTKKINIINDNVNVDEDELMTAFREKFSSWQNDIDVLIDEMSTEKHALGTFIYKKNEYAWFGSRVEEKWVIVSHTIGYFGNCQTFEEYAFPENMTPDCWDKEKKIVVDTKNPEKFYNGITIDDKKEIIIAFKEREKRISSTSPLLEKDLYLRIFQNTDTHLKGAVKIGGVDNFSTPSMYAAKNNNSWEVLYNGQESPPCTLITRHGFPMNMFKQCLDYEKNIFIDIHGEKDLQCEIEQNPKDICEGMHLGAEFDKGTGACKIVSWGCDDPPFYFEDCETEAECTQKALDECRKTCETNFP